MPNRDSGYASGVPAQALPSAGGDPGRSAMLDGIAKAGGIGSLKKVDKTQIRDRSGASVPGNESSGGSGAGAVAAGVAGGAVVGAGAGGMADALAAALASRKQKVGDSDDENDDDDW